MWLWKNVAFSEFSRKISVWLPAGGEPNCLVPLNKDESEKLCVSLSLIYKAYHSWSSTIWANLLGLSVCTSKIRKCITSFIHMEGLHVWNAAISSVGNSIDSTSWLWLFAHLPDVCKLGSVRLIDLHGCTGMNHRDVIQIVCTGCNLGWIQNALFATWLHQ